MAQDTIESPPADIEEALPQLERQVERGSLFTHTALSSNAGRINEVESVLYGLVDVMVKQGTVTAEAVFEAAKQVRHEMEAKGEAAEPGVALRVDSAGVEKNFVPVNCAERIHICKAACCRLSFALSAEEIESGRVKWDLGQPYLIRQETTGYCAHNDPRAKSCRIYQNRPGVCRNYSCARDERIWKDFERMELNEEWISEHLAESRPHLARARMIRPEDVQAGE